MCSCGKVKIIPNIPVPIIPLISVNCEVNKVEIDAIYNSLLCLKSKNLSILNQYLGQVLTMINLQDYCKYDTSKMKELILKHNC